MLWESWQGICQTTKSRLLSARFSKLIEAVLNWLSPLLHCTGNWPWCKTGDVEGMFGKWAGLYCFWDYGTGVCPGLPEKWLRLHPRDLALVVRNDLCHHINSLSHREIDRLEPLPWLPGLRMMSTRCSMQSPCSSIGDPGAVFGHWAQLWWQWWVDLPLSLAFIIATPRHCPCAILGYKRSVPYFRGHAEKLDRISLVAREGLSRCGWSVCIFPGGNMKKNVFEKSSTERTKPAQRFGWASFRHYWIHSHIQLSILRWLRFVWFGGTVSMQVEWRRGSNCFLSIICPKLCWRWLWWQPGCNLYQGFRLPRAVLTKCWETTTSVPGKKKNPVVWISLSGTQGCIWRCLLCLWGFPKYALEKF